MHDGNRFYGHDRVLRDYCGVRAPRDIPGSLQHGWTMILPFSAEELRTPWPKLVWSRRSYELVQDAGVRVALPVGSPFLYLPPVPPPENKARRLLVFPFHGWEEAQVADVERAYAAYADSLEQLAKTAGFDEVTVCLYWLEHQDPNLRAVFASRGFGVTTNGHRDNNPSFLHKARALLLQHSHATSNRLCTALFYALATGLPSFLYGPPTGLTRGPNACKDTHRRWELATFPALSFERFDGSVQREIADAELGAEFKLAPDVMRELFGWSGSSIAIRLQRRLERSLWPRYERLRRRTSRLMSQAKDDP